MSELEQDALVGKLVREYRETRERVKNRRDTLEHISECFQALGNALAPQKSGGLRNPAQIGEALSRLPDDVSASRIRSLVSEYTSLLGTLEGQVSQLKAYGLEDLAR